MSPRTARRRSASTPARSPRRSAIALLAAGHHSIDAARASGYGQLPEGSPLHYCIDHDLDLDDIDGTPAMRVHLVKCRPARRGGGREAARNGGVRLVAVEYVVFEVHWLATGAAAPPRLPGQAFDHVEAPNRYRLPSIYALHAWVWRHNSDGIFAEMNRQVGYAHGTP